MTNDQGHDHLPNSARGKAVGQGHVGVKGLVKDEERGEIIRGF